MSAGGRRARVERGQVIGTDQHGIAVELCRKNAASSPDARIGERVPRGETVWARRGAGLARKSTATPNANFPRDRGCRDLSPWKLEGEVGNSRLSA